MLACPLCSCKTAKFYGQGHAPVIAFEEILGGAPLAIETSYYQCVECGLIYQNPRLSNVSLNELYSSGDYRKLLNNTQENIDKDEMERQERIAPKITGTGSHLDIGCSRGYLLSMSQAVGRVVMGVEPNANYTNEGIEVVASLDDVSGKWDWITCLHVFEHVPDPVGYAAKIIDLLNPGGCLILEVPSENSKGGPLRLWHLFLFKPPVIMRIFEGLRLLSFTETPHYLFVFEKG